MRLRPSFTRNTITPRNAFRRRIMADPNVTQALQRYVNNYNTMLNNLKLTLNQAVNNGKITQEEANKYFQNFSQGAFKNFQFHVAQFEFVIQKKFADNQNKINQAPDQTNLSITSNMQLALQNSASIVSQYAAATVDAIIEQENLEEEEEEESNLTISNSMEEEARQVIDQIQETETAENADATEHTELSSAFCNTMENLTDTSEETQKGFFENCKGVLEKGGITKEILNSVKFLGKDMGEPGEEESLFKAPTLKPPKFPDDGI